MTSDSQQTGDIAKCPVMGGHVAASSSANVKWWPNKLNLNVLHQNSAARNPMGEDFNYAEEFKSLDLSALKSDLEALMTDSQPFWPADYGHYGPFFIRMAWHSAGTYRNFDGRGGGSTGNQRFAPLNSWPDNVNLDKARLLLWPIKQKYGRKISWGDLMILTGNVALESMGLKTYGFGGGRVDAWEPEEDIYWGPEAEWLADERYSGERDLEKPLGAVQMGLIYVNPEGPNGNPDPMASAFDIRDTFARMGMDDEETVALIAGGHTFGKAHGAADPDKHTGPEPEAAGLEEQSMGWTSSHGTGSGGDTIGSGLEGAWTSNPIAWDNNFFDNLFGYEWVQTKSPAGATQWTPKEDAAKGTVPDAHDANKKHAPVMFTSDLALRTDPEYTKISKRFHANPDQFAAAFAKAWYKLTHRDMGPLQRYLGAEVPAEPLLWQDPIPAATQGSPSADELTTLKTTVLASGLPLSQLVSTAWASASTFRCSDMRGGANGARLRLSPQKDWEVNNPTELANTLQLLGDIRATFNANGSQISLADLIVLAGGAAIESAAEKAGVSTTVPFTAGRSDAVQDQTDADSFDVLEPVIDGFRNYVQTSQQRPAEEALVDRAQLLSLTAPEMTVLLGGMRVLDTNADKSANGVFTDKPGTLSNDFFVNLLDMSTQWKKTGNNAYTGTDRATGSNKWTATAVDLVFGSNSELRAIAEVYGCSDAQQKFVEDFVAAWNKVMNLDRFDLS